MGAKMFFNDVEMSVTISTDEYNRFRKAVEKSANIVLQSFRNMNNGVIVNLNHVSAIVPDAVSPEVPVMVAEPIMNGAVVPPPDVEQETAPPAPVTRANLNDIMEAKKLKPHDLSAALAYSAATVRMALKGDRISDEFAAKVVATYPEFFPGPQKPQFHPAEG